MEAAARALIRALFAGRAPGALGGVQASALFQLADVDATQRGILAERGAALAEVVGAPAESAEDQLDAIVAIHTAVAMVARLLAAAVTDRLADGSARLAAVAAGPTGALRAWLAALEAGHLFDGRGVPGLVGDDPYGWYLARWGPDVEAGIRGVAGALAGFAPDGPVDHFSDLTQRLVPAPVRHALGEFYTPPWLADAVVEGTLRHAGARPGWRALDPCCGSGAFLLPVVRRLLAETAQASRAARLAVLDRVAGVDLHPLAALTARVNLLVAVAPHLARGDRLRLPVLRADATAGATDPRLPALGAFDAIVGNPPWVDWKRLPPAQRAALLERGPARHLFAGDSLVGGVSLNVCALVAGTAAETWLAPGGVLGFLMPRTLAFQQSYAGFRALRRPGGGSWRLVALEDWSAAGHPFAPVTEPVITWYMGDGGSAGPVGEAPAASRGTVVDRGLARPAGARDAAPTDAPPTDAAPTDAAPTNAAPTDAAPADAAPSDAAPIDAAPTDAAPTNAAPTDAAPTNGVPLTRWRLRPGGAAALADGTTAADARDRLHADAGVAGPVAGAFVFATSAEELARFDAIAGTCAYVGREGVEFYPQETWLWEPLGPAADGRVPARNYQGRASRYRVPAQVASLEDAWLHPLVRGVDIGRFQPLTPSWMVPFPYAPGERTPVPMDVLHERAPVLAAWLVANTATVASRSAFDARLLGRAGDAPHALARVGRYSWADAWVAFRDNTRWGATVVTAVDTHWGGRRRPCFQNHAVSMCERSDGKLIDEEEAHYVCAALNAPVVGRFLAASSGSRSFRIRPPVRVPLFRPADPDHRALSALSRRAHARAAARQDFAELDEALDAAYLRVVAAG